MKIMTASRRLMAILVFPALTSSGLVLMMRQTPVTAAHGAVVRPGATSSSSILLVQQEQLSLLRGGGFPSRSVVSKKHQATISKSALFQSGSSSSTTPIRDDADGSSSSNNARRKPLDFAAIAKYVTALAVQMSIIFGIFTGIDTLLARLAINKVPFYLNSAFFYAFNLNTSVFSILPQKKEKASKLQQQEWGYQKRNRPSWTPPGWVFGVMWPLFVFGLRAVTAAMIVSSTNTYANPACMALMFHLCIANLWNTVNNVEKRLGFSVILLYGLWITKAVAAYQFFKIDETAGKLLAATLTWLTAAAALETRTWQLNPDPDTRAKEPLYPAKADKWKTKFRWEA